MDAEPKQEQRSIILYILVQVVLGVHPWLDHDNELATYYYLLLMAVPV